MNEVRRDYRSEILRFVGLYIEEYCYPPTVEEIRESLGLRTKSHVDYYLESLEAADLIERKARTPHGPRLLSTSRGAFDLRVRGTISAGQPIVPKQGEARTIAVTADIVSPRRDLFALLVKGDSMIDALVGNGDILIVEPTPAVETGETAVVYLTDRNAATLKRVSQESGMVRLQPANDRYAPVLVDARHVEVQGRVAAVVRKVN
jgi:repressor LexA